jgi:hypothetical protein
MIMEEHEEAKCALACIVYSSYDASEWGRLYVNKWWQNMATGKLNGTSSKEKYSVGSTTGHNCIRNVHYDFFPDYKIHQSQ